uniref:Acyl carrier protein 1ic-like n=1 Tax=Rhizophora mucronata TaxID=61149 RepID=A0A2P2K0S7_RHIMU
MASVSAASLRFNSLLSRSTGISQVMKLQYFFLFPLVFNPNYRICSLQFWYAQFSHKLRIPRFYWIIEEMFVFLLP